MKAEIFFGAAALSLLLVTGSVSVALAKDDTGREMSEQHRSKVASVVQDLTDLAGKDRNIGEDVRAVAQEQEASKERAAKAIEAVEARSGFKTFLIGTDYKNLGALRSEVVTAQNSVDRLTKAMERAVSEAVKADLDAQIKALQEARTNALNFIQANENKFSLFGWLVKLLQ